MKNSAKNIVMILLGTVLLHGLYLLENIIMRMIEEKKQGLRNRKPEKVNCVTCDE